MHSDAASFDPIIASNNLKSGFIDYITTTFHIADPGYKADFVRELEKPGFLTKGPYLDMNGSYKTGRSLRQLMAEGLASAGFDALEPVTEKDRELKVERPLYLHQEQALLKADAGNNLIVTTGTGSGKTECFLLPILQALLKEEEHGPLDSGVRAILIYPMNALANDQMKRMRKIMKGHKEITFGIYTGNTEQTEREAKVAYRKSYGPNAQILENELLSRDRMRETPPHILITNYSMLEYMMLRPKDDKVFSGAKLRYIILDEAHVYKGTTGMETAMLMRRLRARISTRDQVQFILTSATLGGEDANREITQFGYQLCGVDFKEENIIRSQDATPPMREWKDYPAELYRKLANPANHVGKTLEEFQIEDPAPGEDANAKLYEFLLTSRHFAQLRREAAHTMELTALSKTMGLTRQELLDLVAVCTRAEKNKTALLKARIHYFVRALEGAYVTVGKNPMLTLTRQEHTKDGRAIFEVAICQDCGRLALVGRVEEERLMQVSRKTDSEPEKCEYFLLWDGDEEQIVFDDELESEDELEETDEADFAVCAHCGKIDGYGNLRFGNICDCEAPEYIHVKRVNRTKTKKAAKCPACGRGEFRAFYLGNGAATSVLGTELFEQLPTKTVTAKPEEQTGASAGRFRFSKPKAAYTVTEKMPQFLCFSDSRSEAAHFAVEMEREYQRFLRNRGMLKVAKELQEKGYTQISVPAFVDKLADLFKAERSFDHWESDRDRLDADKLNAVSEKNAWIAVTNELFNSRHANSLTSAGLLYFQYESEEYTKVRDAIAEELMQTGLKDTEAEALMQRMFMDGVYTGALNAGKTYKFTPEERESIFFTDSEPSLVKVRDASSKKWEKGWSARARAKSGYYPSVRMRRLVLATGWDEEYANGFLQAVWDAALADSDAQFVFDICHFSIHFPDAEKHGVWRCKKCGKVSVFNVQNRCRVLSCGGRLEEVTPSALQEGNHYVNRYRGERMKPLQMREHTAQLSRNCQTQYQQAFVEGKLNALSCSTTFEMGVDVGGLETVYMRDVPPGPSNYVQRAGRAGRAAHTAAYVLTYAKLSSHDFTFYNKPETVISGKIKAPVFALENEKVLYRHIFAVALAEFLAVCPDIYGGDNRHYLVNDGGYEKLKDFLAEPGERLVKLLERSVPRAMHERMGICDGSWRDQLIGENGVLEKAVADYREELEMLQKEFSRAEREKNHDEASRLGREINRFRAAPDDKVQKKSLIEFLTRSNVLPKYGFPVDTVELMIGTSASNHDDGLQLSRDLQMAIAEYAPGSEVIADGKMYTSRYIRKAGSKGKNDPGFEYGYYAQCPNCRENNFTDNPLARRVGLNCISCEKKIPKNRWNRTIEPRLGFIAEDPNGKPVPMHKPERDYKTEDYYVGDGRRTILRTQEFNLGDEVLRLQSTKNDSLAVVGLGEHIVCPLCGYATDKGETVLVEKHKNARGYECGYRSNGLPQIPVRLSHVFKTDVASISFLTADAADDETMISVMYAILEGLSKELDIERTDIKGCLHRIKWEGSGQPIHSIILYDAVAGGAGHVRRIVTEDGQVFERVLRRAYEIVSECKCAPSCYSCIRNYYNQKIHDKLDRKKAAAFLRRRLVPCVPIQEQDSQQSIEVSGGEPATQYPTWEELYSVSCFEQDGAALDSRNIPREECLVMPDMKSGDQRANPYLVWMKEKVILFDEPDEEWMQIAENAGWKADTMDLVPEKLEKLLRGVD